MGEQTPSQSEGSGLESHLDEHERELYDGVLAGDEVALARTISVMENRDPGYRSLVGALHRAASGVPVVGVTGRPGAGKSTLVDGLARRCHDRGERVGVIAVDPASPYSGGAVLGDRIRMADCEDVFVRSMSTRGALGGLSAATSDAITAMDAFGVDRIFVETVGAGQSEVEIAGAADTVAVLVPPDSGDDIQMLKAGLLEVGDLFVVNKADLAGADRTVAALEQMLGERHHTGDTEPAWEPPVIETVATRGEGIESVLDGIADHAEFLETSGEWDRHRRRRQRTALRELLRAEAGDRIEAALLGEDGLDRLVEQVADRELDRYAAVEALLDPIEECLAEADRSELLDPEG